MTKRVLYAAMAAIVLWAGLSACQRDPALEAAPEVPEGYVALCFDAVVPQMEEVVTRSVDPDGNGVQNLTLFCFDSYGLFISTATATMISSTDESGSFRVEIPENTRTIHFLANQNMSEFSEDEFRSRSEAEVMSVLEGSSGRMIYWARFACNPDDDTPIDAQLVAAGGKITMIRNHAQVSIDNPDGNGWFVVTGFAVYNTNAFGTVAPYHPEKGFDFTWPTDEFVTLPVNTAKMSDVVEVSTAATRYVFECENRVDDPVSVIVRGHLPSQSADDDLYYRVLLLDEQGEQLLIRRNFHYKLHIQGTLSFGQPTFEEATRAAATNNVWVSISDNVTAVEDQKYVLSVDQTVYVLNEDVTGATYTLNYTLKGKNGTSIQSSDKPTVTWLDGNQVAGPGIGNTFNVVSGTGVGNIQIALLPMGDNAKLEGTLLVQKGRLQRKIKVISIKKQQFVPAWVGTRVWGNIDSSNPTEGRAHVTMMFTIPDDCPQEVFPLRVLITTNELDVRAAAGVSLPVIRAGEEGYGEPNDYGYKYVYTVHQTGIQRVYFENVLNQSDNAFGRIRIEADYFDTLEKAFTFSDNQYSITVAGLSEYSASDPAGENYAADEVILYRLVPQKRSAYVQFDMVMEDNAMGTNFNVGATDEFLLYSQHLDYYQDEEAPSLGLEEFDCLFYEVDPAQWSSGGRVLMFQPRNPDKTGSETGHYSIYMKTNRAVSAEVVRIASNQAGSSAVLPANGDASGAYIGNSYRSVTFELANYRPFRFAARVNGIGSDASGSDEEQDTPLVWTYEPSQKVDLALDVTSFGGADGKSVDPFGEAFEIYIDAPMLEIDEARLAECNLTSDKLRKDPNREGRFIYTVDAARDAERVFGTGTALLRDESGLANQSGERKTLPFRTSSIVNAGDIVLSSNEEKVVFFEKKFVVSNAPIAGRLTYRDSSGVEHAVPRNAFVAFERVRNNSRIGSMTVTADGQYELRLRKEYQFNWYTDEVEIYYEDTAGNVYHRLYPNLAGLFAAPDVVLEPMSNE